MNAILSLPTDTQVWEMQQARRKPVFRSASMTLGQNLHLNNFASDAMPMVIMLGSVLGPTLTF